MPIEQRSYRKALGCFATGVTVVTTLDPVGKVPLGVTISSFCSLSLDPALVLFCLGRRTSSLEAYRTAGFFAVNVLTEGQRDLSMRFASRGGEKWAGLAREAWDTGAPILSGCLANIECRTVEIREGGDHDIFIGEVLRLRHQEGGAPLVHFRGAYMDLGPPAPVGGDGL